eukprot:9437636-Ditylum_brightwellii.AAC.1
MKKLNAIGKERNDDDDPFSCSDLIVPATHTLVEEALKEGIQSWNELDSRKIENSDEDDDGDNDGEDDDDEND